MQSSGLFGPTISLLSKILDLRSKRQILISSNIANIDTPGYKAVDLDFEQELQKAIGSQEKIELKRTDEKHLPSFDMDSLSVRTVSDPSQSLKADGNTVDMDKELAKMSKNELMYNAIVQVLRKEFSLLKYAIREGK